VKGSSRRAAGMPERYPCHARHGARGNQRKKEEKQLSLRKERDRREKGERPCVRAKTPSLRSLPARATASSRHADGEEKRKKNQLSYLQRKGATEVDSWVRLAEEGRRGGERRRAVEKSTSLSGDLCLASAAVQASAGEKSQLGSRSSSRTPGKGSSSPRVVSSLILDVELPGRLRGKGVGGKLRRQRLAPVAREKKERREFEQVKKKKWRSARKP